MVKKKARLFQLRVDPETGKRTAQYEVELTEWELNKLKENLGEEVPITI